MGQRTIEVEDDSLERAKARLKAEIPEGYFLVSQEVLMDGIPKLIEAMADTIDGAYLRAESDMPTSSEIVKREVLQNPGKRLLGLQADDDQGARDEAARVCHGKGALLDLKLISPGRRGFLGIGRTANQYEAEVMDLAIVRITGRAKARVKGILDDRPPLQLLYADEQKYYPVAPVEIMVVLCDANFPSEEWEMFAKNAVNVADYIPSGRAVKVCDVTYPIATSGQKAMELVFRESAKRNLNAVIISLFEGSAFVAQFSFVLAVLTTVPSGKKPFAILAGENAAVVLKARDA